MKLLTVDTIEEARQKLLSCTSHWKVPVEQMGISQALNRILAEDIYITEEIPAFRRSTVDGYAVICTDISTACDSQPVFLKLKGSVQMGKPTVLTLQSGECVYVPTGGMIPENANAIVMIEYTEIFDSEIAVYKSSAEGSYVVRIGEDAQKGNILLKRGVMIRSAQTGALAAAGIMQIPVYKHFRLFIISSGDELVDPSTPPRIGEVRDINTLSLSVLARESGFQIAGTQTLKDDEKFLEEAVRNAMEISDIVVLSGGSSQGEKDMTEKVFSKIAKPGVFTNGLAIKPGKPTILCYDKQSDIILAGLPGHPVSALMVFKILLSWLVMQLTGQKEQYPIPAKLSCNIAGSEGRTVYQLVSLHSGDEGFTAQPVFGKSGMISTLTNADGYITIDKNKEGIQKGETVQVYLWD